MSEDKINVTLTTQNTPQDNSSTTPNVTSLTTNQQQNINKSSLLTLNSSLPNPSLPPTAQDHLSQLFQKLKKNGVSDEELLKLGEEMTGMITDMTVGRVIGTMTDGDIERFKKVEEANPTDAQMLVILDRFSIAKTGKGIEDLQEEVTIELVKLVEQEINHAQDITQKIMALPKDKFSQLEKALAEENFEEARKIVSS